ncbi:MAG: PAS domain-containing protein [Pseudomonadota bacterium]|nr:PAS domain-containing protein [Pseudomonadota bacterium]
MPMLSDGRALMDALSTPVLVVDGQGRLEWINQRARQLVGEPAPETLHSLLASPSSVDGFLRTMRRNKAFAHMALPLRAPLQDSYIASTRIVRQGAFLEYWLLELLPRQQVVGGDAPAVPRHAAHHGIEAGAGGSGKNGPHCAGACSAGCLDGYCQPAGL